MLERTRDDRCGAAKSFFGELLGGGIRALSEQERGVPPSWLPYFTVDNAENAARGAERLGGRTLMPTTHIRIGRFAVIADPQRAMFALFEGETDP